MAENEKSLSEKQTDLEAKAIEKQKEHDQIKKDLDFKKSIDNDGTVIVDFSKASEEKGKEEKSKSLKKKESEGFDGKLKMKPLKKEEKKVEDNKEEEKEEKKEDVQKEEEFIDNEQKEEVNKEEKKEEFVEFELVDDQEKEQEEAAKGLEDKKEKELLFKEEEKVVQSELPEGVKSLVDFMNETGGSLDDYVRLNRDFSKMNDNQLLKEYYASTKSYLDPEDIDFLIEDKLIITEEDKDNLSDRELKRKKLAFKEEVVKAKDFLNKTKDKYYNEILPNKALNKEQQEAIDFYKQHKDSQEVVAKRSSIFNEKTEKFFNEQFKGFEFKVGEKTYRFNVKDKDAVKGSQGSLDNFVKKFLDKEGAFNDPKGYHKAFFTAMNADKIANHFYEQGKADAISESVKKSKNIDMDGRKMHDAFDKKGSFRMVALDNESGNTSKLRIKTSK
jgi:hypothetical protein